MSDRSESQPAQQDAQRPHPQQVVKFSFYRLDRGWRGLPEEERSAARKELAELLTEQRARFPLLRTYSTVGMRGDCDFLVWSAAKTLEEVAALETEIRRSAMGPYLETPWSFLAMTKRSQYEDRIGEKREKLQVKPGRARYLFVYPFVKTRAWYMLPFEERQAMMDRHIEIGHRFPTVKLNTTYSFGLDDQEFVVAFETDHPEHFLDLVMQLREARSSEFTLRDTPIFSCIAGEPLAVLEACG